MRTALCYLLTCIDAPSYLLSKYLRLATVNLKQHEGVGVLVPFLSISGLVSHATSIRLRMQRLYRAVMWVGKENLPRSFRSLRSLYDTGQKCRLFPLWWHAAPSHPRESGRIMRQFDKVFLTATRVPEYVGRCSRHLAPHVVICPVANGHGVTERSVCPPAQCNVA